MSNEDLLEAVRALLEEKTKIDLVSLTEQVSEETGYKRSEVYQILAAAFDLIEGYCYDEE